MIASSLISILLQISTAPTDTTPASAGAPVNAMDSTQATQSSRTPRIFSLIAENDVLFVGGGTTTDEHYTNGVQAIWTSFAWPSRLASSRALKWWPNQACPVKDESEYACGVYSVGVGQTMYTPSTIRSEGPIPDDRPFAGWAYLLGNVGILRHPHALTIEVQAGIMGPAAGAQYTQSMAHWWWSAGSVLPRGWDHQLDNQFAGNINLRYALQGATPKWNRFSLEGSPRLQLQLGSVTAGRTGLKIRGGWNMPREFLHGRIPVSRGGGDVNAPWWDQLFVALSSETELRAVGYNAFLSGGYADDKWRSIERIDTRVGGVDRYLGITIGLPFGVTAAHQWAWRSREFDAPFAVSPLPDTHRFGVTTLSMLRLR